MGTEKDAETCAKGAVHMLPGKKGINEKNAVRVVNAYLKGEVYTGRKKLDFKRIHHYLMDLAPYAEEPDAAPELQETVARLYYEETQYQEAAKLLRRAGNPAHRRNLAYADLYNAYYASVNSWKARQERVWSIFLAFERRLSKASPGSSKPLTELKRDWESCFPTQEVQIVPPAGGQKGEICLGVPDGILSLYPMLYLTRHVSWKGAQNWNVVLEPTETAPQECMVLGRPVPAAEILLGIRPHRDNQAVLTVYHPNLAQAMRSGWGQEAGESAVLCVNQFLPMSARLLYGVHIALAENAPAGVFPLPALREQLEARGMDCRIPLDQVLERRRRSYTREPIRCARPRTDITRGETCMPELEELYFLRKEEYLTALQRYGVGAWFFTIPRNVCGEDFQTFRKDLEDRVRRGLGDGVCFTGWAEGTKNCYIDLLAADGRELLRFFEQDPAWERTPHSKTVRCCTFYWDSALRSIYSRWEIRQPAKADIADPGKGLVSERQRAAMERYFQNTVWGEMEGLPRPQLEDAPYEGDLISVQERADGPAAAPDVPPDPCAAVSAEPDPAQALLQQCMADPALSAVMKKLAERAADGTLDAYDDDGDGVVFIPSESYEDFLTDRPSAGKNNKRKKKKK